MPKFEVYIREHYRKSIVVDALDKEEALEKAKKGEGEETSYRTLDSEAEVTEA